MMAVDPADDCTFWYTQEYYGASSSAGWTTRVASFKLANCGGTPSNTAPTVSINSPGSGATVSGTAAIRIAASDNEDATGSLTVQWNVDGGTWQSAAYNSASGFYEASWITTTASDGPHTVNARATDSGALASNASANVTVANAPPDTTTIHVGDLDGTGGGTGNTWTASVVISVHTASHGPVAGAVVSGSWSNGATGSASCTTLANGQCTVSKAGIAKKTASVRWTVSGVTLSGKTYSAAANHDPETDSNGTTIVVRKQ
jgi:hypothetical protein